MHISPSLAGLPPCPAPVACFSLRASERALGRDRSEVASAQAQDKQNSEG